MTFFAIVSTWFENVLFEWTVLLLDAGLKGAFLLLAALLAVLALRRSSAALRHMVLTTGIVSILALPFLSLVVPEWRAPVLPDVLSTSFELDRTPLAPAIAVSPPAAETPTAIPAAPDPRPMAQVPPASRAPEARPVPHKPAQASALGGAAPGSSQGSTFTAINWQTWTLAIWMVGALGVFCWVALGYLVTWWLARSANRITNGPILDLVDELSEELGITAPVTLLEGAPSAMPRTWGVKPKLLLPVDAREWTDVRLRAVLLHELAHVKRHDYLTQLLAQLALTVHWFNPLAWIAARRMRVERERACDDQVLATGSKASDYAEHLLDIASSMKAGAFTSAASIAMARRSHLSDRLLDVLDATRRRTKVTPRLAGMVWAASAFVVIPTAGVTATVADSDSADDLPTMDTPAAGIPATESDPSTGRSEPTGARVPASRLAWLESRGLTDVPVRNDAPAASQQCDWYRRDRRVSTSMQVDDEVMRVRIELDDCQLRIEADGQIEFNDAETDIVYISRGGAFEIEKRDGGMRRRLEVQPAGGGSLEYRWFVDGEEQPYDRAARDWFASFLPLVFRTTGFQAEQRATRILERDGVDGVLQEISYIRSDYVARKYFEVVLTRANLSEQQLRKIVRQAGNELDSDYELAELLIHIAEAHPVDESVQIAYVEAAGSIESDYETRRVLDAVLDRPGLSQEVAHAMLQLAMDIESDYELAELLIGMMNRHPIQDALTPEFFAAVDKLESDYEHRRVLSAALERGAPDQEVLDLTLNSAMRIDGDYEKAELLLQVGELYPTDRAIPDSFLEAAGSISSDYERKRVLGVLVERGHLNTAALSQLLEIGADMGSDYELAELLVAVCGTYEFDPTTYEPFFRALDRVDGDYERSRVLKSVLEAQTSTDEMLEAVLNASASISSDYERSSLLVSVVEGHTLNDRLRELYVDVAEGISSSYERDKALAALVRATPR